MFILFYKGALYFMKICSTRVICCSFSFSTEQKRCWQTQFVVNGMMTLKSSMKPRLDAHQIRYQGTNILCSFVFQSG